MMKQNKNILSLTLITMFCLIMLISCNNYPSEDYVEVKELYYNGSAAKIEIGMIPWKVRLVMGYPTKIEHTKNWFTFIPVMSLTTDKNEDIVYFYKNKAIIIFSHTVDGKARVSEILKYNAVP